MGRPDILPSFFISQKTEPEQRKRNMGQSGGDADMGATVWHLSLPKQALVQCTASPGNVS
jgi:hypothetical protein